MKKKFLLLGIVVCVCILGCVSFVLYKESKVYPEIVLIGEEEIVLDAGSNYEELGANAFIKDKDYSDLVLVDGQVDNTKVGTYELVYTIEHPKNGNRSSVKRLVSIVDRVEPKIELNGASEISLIEGTLYEELGAKAFDDVDGDLSEQIVLEGDVNTSKAGEYNVLYKVQDSSGNASFVKRVVKVKEKPKVVQNSGSIQVSNINTNVRGLPVLMYHFFYDDLAGETGADSNWMPKSSFEEQMKYLSDNSYYFPSWKEVDEFVEGKISLPDKSVVITIDDGDITFINHAIPIIEKYGVKATSFAVASWNGDWLPKTYGSNNMIFQSHSYDAHRAGANGKGRLVNMTYNEALDDVSRSRDIIGGANIFCYPFGHYNDVVINALKDANYIMAFTTKYNRVYPGENKYKLPRIRMNRNDSIEVFKEKVK